MFKSYWERELHNKLGDRDTYYNKYNSFQSVLWPTVFVVVYEKIIYFCNLLNADDLIIASNNNGILHTSECSANIFHGTVVRIGF